MASVMNLALRGIQFLWVFLIMALSGNMVSMSGNNAAVVNFALFCSVFGMLSLFYLIPATMKDSLMISPLIMIIVDVLNVLFLFCGGVALAAELGAHSCSDAKYTKKNVVTRGTSDPAGRCREAQAVTAFLWFAFAAFTVSAVLSGMAGRGRK